MIIISNAVVKPCIRTPDLTVKSRSDGRGAGFTRDRILAQSPVILSDSPRINK